MTRVLCGGYVGRVEIRLEFKPEDCWRGFFWRRTEGDKHGDMSHHTWHVWVCLLPMLPLHISWWR